MRFSVVIPTRKRDRLLRSCLSSLRSLDYPVADFEVIVVDDGGGVPARLIEEARAGLDIRLVSQDHHGPATARNRGVAAARGEFIAFTDDDCTVDRGWLRALEHALGEHPEAMIGGGTVSSTGSTIFAVASQNIVDFLYEYYASVPTSLRFFATNNVACRRDHLLALGGFDESFPRAAAEDRDLCERWHEAGRPFHYQGTALVTHHLESTLRHYVSQHLRYGQGATHLNRARQRRGHQGPRLEPVRFYVGLVTYALRRGVTPRNLWLATLAFVSQVAYGIGYYSERLLVRLQRPSEPVGEPEAARPEAVRGQAIP